MSYPITNADVAGILDALGQPAAAETIRWGEPAPAEVVDELGEATAQLTHAEDMLADLESLLCKACAKKWKGQQ